MTPDELKRKISLPEGIKLEFKREYKLYKTPPSGTDKQDWQRFVEGQWHEFIKDILALTNGNLRANTIEGMLIIGVDDELLPDNTRNLYDVSSLRLTPEQILQKVNKVCNPPLPDIRCERVTLNNKEILVIITPSTPYIHDTSCQLITTKGKFDGTGQLRHIETDKIYTEGTTFIRRASMIEVVKDKEEREAIKRERELRFYSSIPSKINQTPTVKGHSTTSPYDINKIEKVSKAIFLKCRKLLSSLIGLRIKEVLLKTLFFEVVLASTPTSEDSTKTCERESFEKEEKQKPAEPILTDEKLRRIALIALGRSVFGGLLGILYGAILGVVVAKIFLLLLEFHISVKDDIYIYGIMFIAGVLGGIGGSLFSLLLGTVKTISTRTQLGAILGLAAGTVSSSFFQGESAIRIVGNFLSSSLIIIFGGIGGIILSSTVKWFLDGLHLNYHQEAFLPTRSVDRKINTSRAIFIAAAIGAIALIIGAFVRFDVWSIIRGEKPHLYIIAKSTPSKDEAVEYANDLLSQGYESEVYSTVQGYLAVTLGYYEAKKAQYVKEQAIKRKVIPDDSFLVGQRGILKKIYPLQGQEQTLRDVSGFSQEGQRSGYTDQSVNDEQVSPKAHPKQIQLENNTQIQDNVDRKPVVVQYFPKKNESQIVQEILEGTGFVVKKGIAANELPTNVVWVGRYVRIDDVKKIILGLLEVGIKLQMIKNFPIEKSSNYFLIQVGSDPSFSDLPAISVDIVKSL